MDISETGVGGYKEAHANIIGIGAFGKMKFESGVHRVQEFQQLKLMGEYIPLLQ